MTPQFWSTSKETLRAQLSLNSLLRELTEVPEELHESVPQGAPQITSHLVLSVNCEKPCHVSASPHSLQTPNMWGTLLGYIQNTALKFLALAQCYNEAYLFFENIHAIDHVKNFQCFVLLTHSAILRGRDHYTPLYR